MAVGKGIRKEAILKGAVPEREESKMKFWQPKIIPEGTKALVTHGNGRVEVADGPRVIPAYSFLTRVQPFDRQVISEGEAGYVIDAEGALHEVFGPAVVHIDPRDGEYEPHERRDLAPHEAMVVIDETGKRVPHLGAQESTVWIKRGRGEKIHQFRWTGSSGDTDYKQPGALRIEVLRLQETQTYLAVDVRTQDNIAVVLHLMVSFEYDDVEKLLKNDDPLGMMFNRIISALVEKVGTIPFDRFKEDVNRHVSTNPIFTTDEGDFAAHGIRLKSAIVRTWEPRDREVQKVMDSAATIITRQQLDEAEHERKMKQLGYEAQELDKAAENDGRRADAARSDGARKALQLGTMHADLKGTVGEELAARLLILEQAQKATALHITPEVLGVPSRS